MVGQTGKVYAVDVYEKEIDALEKEIEKKGIRNIVALVADMTKSMPIDDGVVDVCIMVNVLHGIVANGEIDDVMREVVRVVKPGGALGIVDFKREEGAHGPPMHVRLSPGKAQELVTRFHFRKKELHDIGPSHYLMIINKL